IPSGRRSRQPIPWRQYSVVGAIVLGLLGVTGLSYAIWQNVRDIPISFSDAASVSGSSSTWTDGSSTELPIPGRPPSRGHVALAVSLANMNPGTSDCEDTASLEFAAILDRRAMNSISSRPNHEISVSLEGVVQEASIKVTLHYGVGNTGCKVKLYVYKAVLHD